MVIVHCFAATLNTTTLPDKPNATHTCHRSYSSSWEEKLKQRFTHGLKDAGIAWRWDALLQVAILC